jgi:hypothetical protein
MQSVWCDVACSSEVFDRIERTVHALTLTLTSNSNDGVLSKGINR